MKKQNKIIIGIFILIGIGLIITSVIFLKEEPKEEIKDFWISYKNNFYHFYNFTDGSCEVDNLSFSEMRGVESINFGDGQGVWEIYQEGINPIGFFNVDEIYEKHQVIYFKVI